MWSVCSSSSTSSTFSRQDGSQWNRVFIVKHGRMRFARNHNTETHGKFLRPKQRPPVTDVQVGHASFKPSVGSSCKGGSRGTAPPQLMQFCLCLFSPLSIHPWVSSCLRPLRLPHTSVLHSVDTASSLNLLWSFCLSVFSRSSLSLSLPVLVRACWYQSHWQALWTQLTFLSHSLARPLSLSLSFFLVPVTPLIERAALRPGNEWNSHSVKHLLLSRPLLPALRLIQEARSSTCWL